jgi:hypothetical protein
MRVGYAEFGLPEVFRGRDINFIRLILTKVISIELSVLSSGPDLRHFRSHGRRQIAHSNPSDHLWYFETK